MEHKSKRAQERQERIDGINKLADYALMGILFLFTSIPLLTVGVSISALYKTIYEYKIQEKPKFIHIYVKAFLNSFKQSTIVWLGYLLLILAFVLNRQSLIDSYALLKDALQIFHILMIILATPVVLLMLCYIARFTDNLKTVFKNSTIILLLNIVTTIKLLIGSALVAVCIWLVPILGMILPPFMISKGIEMIEGIFAQFRLANNS